MLAASLHALVARRLPCHHIKEHDNTQMKHGMNGNPTNTAASTRQQTNHTSCFGCLCFLVNGHSINFNIATPPTSVTPTGDGSFVLGLTTSDVCFACPYFMVNSGGSFWSRLFVPRRPPASSPDGEIGTLVYLLQNYQLIHTPTILDCLSTVLTKPSK